MIRRGTGWRPDPLAGERDTPRLSDLRVLADHDDTLPESVDLSHYVVDVLDQGQTESCVAQAFAQAARMRLAVQGMGDPPLPSRRWLYYLARQMHGDEHEDAGTYMYTVPHVMRSLGWPAEAWWMWAEAGVNKPPAWEQRKHAHDQAKGLQEYVIDEGDVTAIRRALAARCPVVAAAHVHGWYDYHGVGYLPMTGLGGGHAVLLVGYSDRDWSLVNSWGIGWGEHGYGRIRVEDTHHLLELRAVEMVRRPTS